MIGAWTAAADTCPSAPTPSSATAAAPPWWAPTAASTGAACRASTRRPSSDASSTLGGAGTGRSVRRGVPLRAALWRSQQHPLHRLLHRDGARPGQRLHAGRRGVDRAARAAPPAPQARPHRGLPGGVGDDAPRHRSPPRLRPLPGSSRPGAALPRRCGRPPLLHYLHQRDPQCPQHLHTSRGRRRRPVVALPARRRRLRHGGEGMDGGAGAPPPARDPVLLVALGRRRPLHRRLPRGGVALRTRAEADDLRAHRRHRGRAHHLAPRGARRPAQLGLPIHLAAGRVVHPLRPLPARPARGGARLLRLAAEDRHRCRQGCHNLYRVDGARTAPSRCWCTGAATAAPGRCASATAPSTSCNSMSTANCSTAPTSTRATEARSAGAVGRAARRRGPRHRGLGASRRLHLGEPRAGTALHVQHADVLGRRRPRPRLAERFGLPYDREQWEEARRAMHRRVTGGLQRRLRSFTQTLGGRTLDAAMLRVAQVGFLEERDPRVASTVRAIARHLARGVLVSRYRPDEIDDGLDHGEEGAFLMCSFWLVDALAHIGEVEEAQRRFERLLAFASPLGLMAEEADHHRGPARQLPAGVHPPGPHRRRRQHRARPPPAARGPRAARRGARREVTGAPARPRTPTTRGRGANQPAALCINMH